MSFFFVNLMLTTGGASFLGIRFVSLCVNRSDDVCVGMCVCVCVCVCLIFL